MCPSYLLEECSIKSHSLPYIYISSGSTGSFPQHELITGLSQIHNKNTHSANAPSTYQPSLIPSHSQVSQEAFVLLAFEAGG